MLGLLIPIVVVSVWLATIALMTWVSHKLNASSIGWNILARRYCSTELREGIVLSDGGMVGRFGIQGRQGLRLAMILARDGVAIRVAATSSLGFRRFIDSIYPPLFLPWPEILFIEQQHVFLGEFHRVRFASAPVEWRIRTDSGETLLAGWKHSRGLASEPPRGVSRAVVTTQKSPRLLARRGPENRRRERSLTSRTRSASTASSRGPAGA